MSRTRGLPLLFAATTLWGTSSAVLSQVTPSLSSGAPLVALGGALALLAAAVFQRCQPWRIVRANASVFGKLGALEAVNLMLFVGALGIGPLPLVVALHLTAPVLLITWEVLCRRRRADVLVVAELLLVVGAIALVAAEAPDGTSSGDVAAGSLLSLGSAVALAVLIGRVARAAPYQEPDAAAGLQLGIAAVLAAPLLVAGRPSIGQAGLLLAVGGGLLGPGFACYWRALRSLEAPMAGIVGLNEALVASLVGAVAFGTAFGPITLLAAAFVLVAVALELLIATRQRRADA